MIANAEMLARWNAETGHAWIRGQEAMDRTLEPLGARAQEALSLRGGECVLDVGCGCGGTTLALARAVGRHGRVTGLDLSHVMLDHARQRATREGLDDRIEWLEHDAQTAHLEHATQDAVFSRFGVMFFDDPVHAFANLGSATRPGGRLAFVCWREFERNPWQSEILRAVAGLLALSAPGREGEPGPFSMADPARTKRILGEAGWHGAECEAIERKLLLGRTLDDACELLLTIGPVAQALRAQSDSVESASVVAAVRSALAPYVAEVGILMPASAWLVTATR
jgi:SAM-dependent methyltransferase